MQGRKTKVMKKRRRERLLMDVLKKDRVDRCGLSDALNEDKEVLSVARQR